MFPLLASVKRCVEPLSPKTDMLPCTTREWQAACYSLQQPAMGRCFLLSTASRRALGYEHNLSQSVIRLWDDTRHVGNKHKRLSPGNDHAGDTNENSGL
jgi:hypothetical protein